MHVAEGEGVVGEDHPAEPQVLGRPLQIGRISGLVGVDEDEVERPVGLGLVQLLASGADVDADAPGHPGLLERHPRHLGALRV